MIYTIDIKSRINQQVKESVPDGKTIRICRAVEVRHRGNRYLQQMQLLLTLG